MRDVAEFQMADRGLADAEAAALVLDDDILGHHDVRPQPALLRVRFQSLVEAASLAGIVVNNAILLVGVIKERTGGETSVLQAAGLAVRARCRPILVSVSTTIMGMAPLLAETSTQAQTLKPLVISVVFGLLASTLLILVVVPSLYAILDDLRLTGMGRREKAP